jgi:hypothetical protein
MSVPWGSRGAESVCAPVGRGAQRHVPAAAWNLPSGARSVASGALPPWVTLVTDETQHPQHGGSGFFLFVRVGAAVSNLRGALCVALPAHEAPFALVMTMTEPWEAA